MDESRNSLGSEWWTYESWTEAVTLFRKHIKHLCLLYIILLLWALNDPLFPRIDWLLDFAHKVLLPSTAPSIVRGQTFAAAIPARELKILPEELMI